MEVWSEHLSRFIASSVRVNQKKYDVVIMAPLLNDSLFLPDCPYSIKYCLCRD